MPARGFLARGVQVEVEVEEGAGRFDLKQPLQVLCSVQSCIFCLFPSEISSKEMTVKGTDYTLTGNICLDLWGFYPHESDCQQ